MAHGPCLLVGDSTTSICSVVHLMDCLGIVDCGLRAGRVDPLECGCEGTGGGAVDMASGEGDIGLGLASLGGFLDS